MKYDGADRARDFVSQWQALDARIDQERYGDILARLQYQAGEAVVWRDAIGNWIFRLSGIPDDKGSPWKWIWPLTQLLDRSARC